MTTIKVNGKRIPTANNLTDSQLWEIVLMPVSSRIPADILQYITSAKREFDSRIIKEYQ